MKALFHRLQRSTHKDKDVVKDRDRDKDRLTTTEKVPQPVVAFKAADFSTAAAADPNPATHPTPSKSPERKSRAISQHGIHRGTDGPAPYRPQSQFELSLQKPLPDITARQPLPSLDEERLGRDTPARAREPSQSTTISSAPTSSRATRDLHDSQGRSTTLSKSTHLNSVSTDNTSVSGSTTPPAPTSSPPPAGSKKVAFISPPPTPGGLSASTPLPDLVTDLNPDSDGLPTTTTTTRAGSHAHSHSLSKATSFPNGTTGGVGPAGNNVVATGSTTNLSLRNGRMSSMSQVQPHKLSTATPPKGGGGGPSSTVSAGRAATSPAAQSTRTFGALGTTPRAASRAEFAQSALSLRSGTPYSHMSNRSAIQMPASWSEAAEEDLVSNLGPRERTRQEVLWEIVASEQRYVTELVKLKESFIDPLLHPYATSPFTSTTAFNTDPLVAPDDAIYHRSTSPTDSFDHLPIASRFLSSPTPSAGPEHLSPKSAGKRKSEMASGPMADAQSIDSDEAENGIADPADEAEAGDKMGRSYMGNLRGMMKDRMRSNSGLSGSGPGKGPPSQQTQGRSPYRAGGSKTPINQATSKDRGSSSSRNPLPARSHQSLPPPPRNTPGGAFATSSRQSLVQTLVDSKSATPSPSSRATPFGTRKLQKTAPIDVSGIDEGMILPPHLLPEDLRICLEVLEGPTLKGHMTLCEGLRRRYDEQYPLVRSLADVFVANSHILQGYATYVLHLERALEQVDNALAPEISKKKPKNQDAADWAKVCRVFKRLEEYASDRGETGLAISLSKPFQRLLKYPLMFQNLLFHTDPSTFEYESTLQMVAEVERIVRSIEDEKIQKEERDQTRDVFARIEGLEKVKMLAIPKPSRVLVEEKVFFGEDPMTSEPGSRAVSPPSSTLVNGYSSPSVKNVKTKSSLKRLSDVLPGSSSKNTVGGKNDLWLVKFNDVVLRCQRTGTTSLPLATGVSPTGVSNGVAGRANSLPDFSGNAKGKYATTGRRHTQVKPRNLYKFIKIETWVIGTVAKPRAGMVSMEDISRSRSNVVSIEPVKSGDTDDEDGDSDDSDRKSKMSFSYWGADKITVDPVASAKARAAAVKTSSRKGTSLAPIPYSRTESTAKAKFGHRLRGADDEDTPTSVRTTAPKRSAASTQSAARRMAAATDDSVTSPRRAAVAPSRASGVVSPTSAASASRRLHNQSTTSNTSALPPRSKVISHTPSVADSGVGVDWIDPSVHRL